MLPKSYRRVNSLRDPRGMVLITAMWICIALTAIVLVLSREMMVESLTARQHLSQAKADAAEIGVEQFVLSVVEQELATPGYKDQTIWEQRQVGDCYFWVLTYNNDDETQYAYGLTDEASKIDINTATVDTLELLPQMDNYPNLAAEIVDWRDADDLVTVSNSGGQGEESDFYQATYGYYAKNAPFESTDEIRLLDGVTDDLLYGADTNHNGTIEPLESANADAGLAFETSMRGLLPFITVYGVKATNPNTASTATSTSLIAALNLSDANGNVITNPIDINSTTLSTQLNQVLQLELPAKAQAVMTAITTRTQPANGPGGGVGGGGGGANGTNTQFTSVFDLAVAAGLTTQDLTAIYPYITALPKAAAAGTTTNSTSSASTLVGKLNVNTASAAALMSLTLPAGTAIFDENDADAIITYRENNLTTQDPTQLPNIAWLMDVVTPQKLVQAGNFLTGASTVFSADIVTVSQDGRAFKRVKIVVDASAGTPQIVYRRDLTDAGWPLDPTIRETLRKGEPLQSSGSGSNAGSRLSLGVK